MMNPALLPFSVLTPTWNRSNYIERVYTALAAQSFKDFEWIVADDGSTDNTFSVVQTLAAKASFAVIYIRANHHVGKICMDNAAIRQASGQFILWCDSDDWLLPGALQRLWETWNSIPVDHRDEYVGITALAATERGVIANPIPDVSYKDISWNDLAEVHCVTGDMLFCARSDALKAHPFPEVDMVIPESVVWTAIGHRLTRLIPEILQIKEYQAVHAISFSGHMSYNRGRAYAMAVTVNNLKKYKRSIAVRIWRLITFIRYCLHGEVGIRHSIKLWGSNTSQWLFWATWPVAWGLAMKDRLQGKVKKTHREFAIANVNSSISVERINAGL